MIVSPNLWGDQLNHRLWDSKSKNTKMVFTYNNIVIKEILIDIN